MSWRRVQVIESNGCSKLSIGIPSKVPSLSSSQARDIMSRASIRSAEPVTARGAFSGLVICVTGLSKVARKQVKDATERLGGEYSPSLHPQCTHLIVQSYSGRKLEHALKHGSKNGLFVVTLAWFVDSVRRNVRLSESLYSVKNVGESPLPLMELNRLVGYGGDGMSCLPAEIYEESRHSNWHSNVKFPPKDSNVTRKGSFVANDCIYIDPGISAELKKKVVHAMGGEGAKILDNWFPGCPANYVVCEGPHIQKYVGHTSHLVTPLWILKSVKEKQRQRLVHLSSDIARQVAVVLENTQKDCKPSKNHEEILMKGNIKGTVEERKKMIELAKLGVRNRRLRRMQSCQMPLTPITPNKLLDSICWSVSEPPTTSAGFCMESCNGKADERESITSMEIHPRPLKESEKMDIVLRSHFLTILFPIDRFGELGPSSRTFFSDGGFTCIQVLDHIYNFYQENMTADEVAVAIHTDSRHGDCLRSLFASIESTDLGLLPCKRIDFLGSRKSFEMLKRINGVNGNIYELMITA